jgi:hypothetical protein
MLGKTDTRTKEIQQCVKGKVRLTSVALMCFGKVIEENHYKNENAETI